MNKFLHEHNQIIQCCLTKRHGHMGGPTLVPKIITITILAPSLTLPCLHLSSTTLSPSQGMSIQTCLLVHVQFKFLGKDLDLSEDNLLWELFLQFVSLVLSD